MAVFPKFKITNKGLDLLNRSIAAKKALTFTKFKIGNGVPSGNWEELNDIVSKFKEFPVLETSVQPNKIVRVKGYFDNKGLTQDYLLKEIGVYAMLEGVAGEVLYSYTNAGDTADTIPDENNGFFSRTFDVANYISNATQITFQVLENRFDFNFNTIEEMRNATFLKAGDRVHLWGKTQLGDTTTKTLIITDSYNGSNDKHTLKNNKIAVVINDIDSKLDKGTYQGDAQDLKDEIDGKVSKTGDIMTGDLVIRKNGGKNVIFKTQNNQQVGFLGIGGNSTYEDIQMYNNICNEQFAVRSDASFDIPTQTSTSAVNANDIVPQGDKRYIILRVAENRHVGENFPVGALAGILKVFRSYDTHIVQMYSSIETSECWIRTKFAAQAWSSWKQITPTKVNTIVFAKGSGNANQRHSGIFDNVVLDIFKDKQFGDGDLAVYDSASKTTKIMKSGRYIIDLSYYYNSSKDFAAQYVIKAYLNNSMIDYVEATGYRGKLTPSLVLDLRANDVLKFTITSVTSSEIFLYTAKEYSRLQLTRISEIGG